MRFSGRYRDEKVHNRHNRNFHCGSYGRRCGKQWEPWSRRRAHARRQDDGHGHDDGKLVLQTQPERLVLVQVQLQYSYDKARDRIVGYHMKAITVAEDEFNNGLGQTVFEGRKDKIPGVSRVAIETLGKNMTFHMNKAVLKKDIFIKIAGEDDGHDKPVDQPVE